MSKDYVILTKQEANKVNQAIQDTSDGVLDKFPYGGWSVDAKAGALKDGKYAMSRKLIEEIERRGGNNATKIGGVDLKNRPDVEVKGTDRVKDEFRE